MSHNSPSNASFNVNGRHSLIELAQAGCDEALGELLEFYRPYFLKIAEDTVASNLRPKLSPSDLVQGSLAIAAEKFDQFRGETDDELLKWVLAIFRNHLTDGIRRFRYAEKRATDREVSEQMPPLEDDLASPSDFASAREDVDRLLIGIERLPEQSRQVVRMRYLENLSYAVIANRLECSPDMARRVWLKAIDELGKVLDR
ncbi:MAG: sigma-70 family RNA polymerase sigma factor [Planctomycetota bacterium]